jgi:hypothetical protein
MVRGGGWGGGGINEAGKETICDIKKSYPNVKCNAVDPDPGPKLSETFSWMYKFVQICLDTIGGHLVLYP